MGKGNGNANACVNRQPQSEVHADIDVSELRTDRFCRGPLALLGNWAVITVTCVLAGRKDHLWGYALAILALGNRQHALAILGHEGAHRLLAKRRWLNDLLTQALCLWPLLTDMYAYRSFHFAHHRHVNTTSDPELEFRKNNAPSWDLPCSRYRMTLRFFCDLVGFAAIGNLQLVREAFPQTVLTRLGLCLMLLVTASLLVMSGTAWVLVLWIAALFTSLGAFMRFRMFIEHLGADDTHRLEMTWWQSWLFAPHYVYMHWEHHRWPGVPCWNLPRVRSLERSVPVVSLGRLLAYYENSPPVASGAPIRDESGNLLVTDLAKS